MSACCSYCGAPGAGLRIATERYAHPACFAEADARAEAEEMLELAVPRFELAEDELTQIASAPRLPPQRAPIQPGDRFGKLLVLRAARRWNRPAWEVQCDCGTRNVLETWTLQTEKRRSCRACANRENGRAKSPLIGGELLVDLARRAGVSPFSIRQRIRMGWPVERLATPARRAGRAA